MYLRFFTVLKKAYACDSTLLLNSQKGYKFVLAKCILHTLHNNNLLVRHSELFGQSGITRCSALKTGCVFGVLQVCCAKWAFYEKRVHRLTHSSQGGKEFSYLFISLYLLSSGVNAARKSTPLFVASSNSIE